VVPTGLYALYKFITTKLQATLPLCYLRFNREGKR